MAGQPVLNPPVGRDGGAGAPATEARQIPQPRGVMAPSVQDQSQLRQMAESLCQALDAKDRRIRLHSQQVASLAYALAVEAGFSSRKAEVIRLAGLLHDIGKIGVPDYVLQKPGKLSFAEMKIMREHPVIGAQIVAPIQGLADETGLADIILHHHERWDGKGYPHGLKRDAIPLGARILAVADAFSAMFQDRPYRKGINCHEAVRELRRVAGKQLDPELAAVFETYANRIMQLHSHRYPSYELIGIPDGRSTGVLIFLPFVR
jgi:putative nucleotidyltransferase with HDIG domain